MFLASRSEPKTVPQTAGFVKSDYQARGRKNLSLSKGDRHECVVGMRALCVADAEGRIIRAAKVQAALRRRASLRDA